MTTSPPNRNANPLLDAALQYGARGWPVLPLCWPENGPCGCGRGHRGRDVGKAPLTVNGVHDATTDAGRIRAFWRQWPSANIGLDLERAGIVVVGPDAPRWASEFANRGLPPTAPTALTGGGVGHQHFYMKRPTDCPARRICKPGEYDVLSAGYAVLPPSRHRSGIAYRWLIEPAGDLPPAPAWAVALLQTAADRAEAPAATFVADLDDDATRVLYDLAKPRLDERIRLAIEHGPGRFVPLPGGDGSRSGADAAVCAALIRAGLTDNQIASIFRAFPIGRQGKLAERGFSYLAVTLSGTRDYLAGVRRIYVCDTPSDISETPQAGRTYPKRRSPRQTQTVRVEVGL